MSRVEYYNVTIAHIGAKGVIASRRSAPVRGTEYTAATTTSLVGILGVWADPVNIRCRPVSFYSNDISPGLGLPTSCFAKYNVRQDQKPLTSTQ